MLSVDVENWKTYEREDSMVESLPSDSKSFALGSPFLLSVGVADGSTSVLIVMTFKQEVPMSSVTNGHSLP